MSFWCLQFLPKTNKNKLTWGIIVVKSNSLVRFLKESSAWKNHYDFAWPLVKSVLPLSNFSLLKKNLLHSLEDWSFFSLVRFIKGLLRVACGWSQFPTLRFPSLQNYCSWSTWLQSFKCYLSPKKYVYSLHFSRKVTLGTFGLVFFLHLLTLAQGGI